MSDTLYGGRRFRTLNVLDEGCGRFGDRIDTSLPADRVIRVLEQVVAWRGRPQAIRLDNGPELIADRFMTWCAEHGIELWYIQPGKPNQNAFIERFNRTYRTEVLNAYVFESLEQVREITAEWLQSYNESGLMRRWQACRPPRIEPTLKPEVLHWQCRLDGGAYIVAWNPIRPTVPLTPISSSRPSKRRPADHAGGEAHAIAQDALIRPLFVRSRFLRPSTQETRLAAGGFHRPATPSDTSRFRPS